MTQEEIKTIMKDTHLADIDLMAWLQMVLVKVNEWKVKI